MNMYVRQYHLVTANHLPYHDMFVRLYKLLYHFLKQWHLRIKYGSKNVYVCSLVYVHE